MDVHRPQLWEQNPAYVPAHSPCTYFHAVEQLERMKLYAAVLDFDAIAEEFSVRRDFPVELHREAEQAVDRFAKEREDLRDVAFVTIDPVGSRDLDQAIYIERLVAGYRVHYAIADVAAFITPGSALDRESIHRGQTIYLPDSPARLHPEELSEDSASLLPGQERPAVVWSIDLEDNGEIAHTHVRRALIRSRARLDYDRAQADLEAGVLHPSIEHLPAVGRLRQESALRRNAINLSIPSQRVVRVSDDRAGEHFEIIIEPRHPIMDYNSEISLLTGMVAGTMMVEAGHGLLRTLAPATAGSEKTFRFEVNALGYDLPDDQPIGEFLQSIDPNNSTGMAVQREAQKLLRGSGYVSVATGEPEIHNGVGGYYAHVTAPLRRLVDRFATEHCLAIVGGYEVPDWVLAAEEQVLESMRRTSSLASQVDNACLDLTEATVLQPWVGQGFDGVVLSSDEERSTARLFIVDPPVFARSLGAPQSGTRRKFTLITADPETRAVQFTWPAD